MAARRLVSNAQDRPPKSPKLVEVEGITISDWRGVRACSFVNPCLPSHSVMAGVSFRRMHLVELRKHLPEVPANGDSKGLA
jgi:hypothetical protein